MVKIDMKFQVKDNKIYWTYNDQQVQFVDEFKSKEEAENYYDYIIQNLHNPIIEVCNVHSERVGDREIYSIIEVVIGFIHKFIMYEYNIVNKQYSYINSFDIYGDCISYFNEYLFHKTMI